MNLKQRLTADLKTAMRAKDNETRDTLRMLQAAVKQVEVDGGAALDDRGVEDVLLKQAKQRRESITEYDRGGRGELAAVERRELAVIERYLPEMLERSEIEAITREAIAETGAASTADMGRVMQRVMPQVKGKADGRVVGQVVRELLAAQG